MGMAHSITSVRSPAKGSVVRSDATKALMMDDLFECDGLYPCPDFVCGGLAAGGTTKNENRTDHCNLTPLVAKSGVAPLGMLRLRGNRPDPTATSCCSLCSFRVAVRT